MTQEQVLQQIRAERALQDARWGPPAGWLQATEDQLAEAVVHSRGGR